MEAPCCFASCIEPGNCFSEDVNHIGVFIDLETAVCTDHGCSSREDIERRLLNTYEFAVARSK